jgi:hypothetical protein
VAEDFMYRRWAVAAASCDEIERLLEDEAFRRSDNAPELVSLVIDGHTKLALELAEGEPLPKFALERTTPTPE